MATVSMNISRIKRLKDSFSMLTNNGRNRIMSDLYQKSLAANLMSENYQTNYSSESQRRWNDIYQPREKLTFKRRDQLVKDSAILRTVIDKITKEMNRNGIKMKKVFVKKCMKEYIEPCKNKLHEVRHDNGLSSIIDDCPLCEYSSTPEKTILHPLGQEKCGEEFQTMQIRCSSCGFPTRDPYIEQKHTMREMMRKRINVNKQFFSQVLHHISIDIEKHDNGFLVNNFLYIYDDDNKNHYSSKKLVNTYRGNPALIRPIIDFNSGELGSNLYTCIMHRKEYKIIDILNNIPRCTEFIEGFDKTMCNQPLYRVEYVQIEDERGESNINYCYIEDEVLHVKKYSPATAMGVSLVDSLYYIVLQLVGQEKWIAEYYLKMRMFKGYLDVDRGMTGTKDIQDMMSAEFKKMREDPWHIPIFTRPKGTDSIKMVRFDDSPKEMQYIENRLEARNQVANAFGVSNVWMNDTSSGAGLNNDGMSMVVTNRTVEHGQKILEEQICIPYTASTMNINVEDVEWYIGFEIHEQQDLMAEKQRKSLDIANALAHQSLGGVVHINDEGETVLSAPIEGKPLQGSNQQSNNEGMDNVAGMSRDGLQYERRAASVPLQGSPSLPNAQGSNLRQKSKYSNYYSFNDEYNDWEWKSDYFFVKFEDIDINDINVHKDYAINDFDVNSGSPRVRVGTLMHYAFNTTIMSPLIVDVNYNLLDGHHRLYAIRCKNQRNIKVAIVKPIGNVENIIKRQYKRNSGGQFSTVEGAKTDSGDNKRDDKRDNKRDNNDNNDKRDRRKKPATGNIQEDLIPKEEQQQLEDKYNKRHYTAQQRYNKGYHSNTLIINNKKHTIGLNLAKEVLGNNYIDVGNIKPGAYNSSEQKAISVDNYTNSVYGSYRKMASSLKSKIGDQLVDYTTPIDMDSNTTLIYGGNFNDFINILDKKEIDIDKINITTNIKAALANNEVLFKFKKGEGQIFLDPDPYTSDGYIDEQKNDQYIKMYRVPISDVREIMIKEDVMSDTLKEVYKKYLKKGYYILPIKAVL